MLLSLLHLTRRGAAAAQLNFSLSFDPTLSSGSEETVPEAQPYFASNLSRFFQSWLYEEKESKAKQNKNNKQNNILQGEWNKIILSFPDSSIYVFVNQFPRQVYELFTVKSIPNA